MRRVGGVAAGNRIHAKVERTSPRAHHLPQAIYHAVVMVPGDVPVPIPGDGVPGDGIVGDDLVGAEPADKRLVGDAADGDDDGGASRLGDLHGEVANPTAGTDDQNVLTGSEVMLIEELRDGDPGEDQRGGLGVGQRRGLACHLVEGHADELGEGASERGNRPVHLVADGVTAPGRGVLDDAAEVEPGDSAVDEPSRQRSEEGGQFVADDPLGVHGIDTARLDADKESAFRGRRGGRTRRDDPDTLERRAIVHRSAHGGVRSEAARPRPKTLTRREI